MRQPARAKIDSSERCVALYHRVYRHEGFEESAQSLFNLVKKAQQDFPGKRRSLFLDIDGHRNSKGGFDHDMFELQTAFVQNFLGRFLSDIHCPLAHTRSVKGQEDDIPDALQIKSPDESGPKGTAEPDTAAD
jgi:hypothetical protein